MNVVVNCTPLLVPRTGVGQYTYHLARTLRELDPSITYWYFYGRYTPKLAKSYRFRSRLMAATVKFIKSLPVVGNRARKAKNWLARLNHPRILFDVYFEPNFIPLAEIRARRIVTVVHDFSFRRHPEWHPPDRVDHFARHFDEGILRSDRILVDSRFTLKEGLALGLPAEKVEVVYPGFEEKIFRPLPPESLAGVRRRHRLPEKFLFFVGSVEPRKNLHGLLQAYRMLPAAVRRELALVICGGEGWLESGLLQELKSGGSLENARFIGYVNDEDLAGLYNLAFAFLFPSFYEGFGLPPLEAMACGCPVIVSRTASLPEVCGGAALYCSPHDPATVAAAVERLLDSPAEREALCSRGRRRAGKFTWKRTARRACEIWKELADR